MRLASVLVGALAACSSPAAAPANSPEATSPAPAASTPDAWGAAAAIAPSVARADGKRWFAGDVHMHVRPVDSYVDMSVSDVAASAKRMKLDFVVLTPHLRASSWGDDYRRLWRTMASQARKANGVTLIPGIEWTTSRGHFNVMGVDIDTLAVDGTDVLGAANTRGAVISVNHPFAVPTRIPGVGASHSDLSYRAWTNGDGNVDPIGAVEVWNLPLSMANIVSRPGGATAERRAWTAAHETALARRRKIAAVGGTDNHKRTVLSTTWVLAKDASVRSIVDALRDSATCVGGPEAGSLRARGDGDAKDRWASIGGTIAAPRTATLAWDGVARLFVDDVDVGEHDGGYTHATDGKPHTYRIEQGRSRCSFIYANL